MTKLEVLQKGDPLFHAYVAIHFKAYVGNRISWIQIPNNILCDYIQGWCLLTSERFTHVRKLITACSRCRLSAHAQVINNAC